MPLGRNGERARAIADELPARDRGEAKLLLRDLASRVAIDEACERLLADPRPLPVLCNNAGAVFREGHEGEPRRPIVDVLAG